MSRPSDRAIAAAFAELLRAYEADPPNPGTVDYGGVFALNAIRNRAAELDASGVESAPGFYLASFKRRSIDGMVTWWAPGSCGYTTDLNTAGVYCDEANANEYTVPVPVAFIDSLRVRRVIDPGDTGNEAFHSAAHLRDALLAAAPAAAQENAP